MYHSFFVFIQLTLPALDASIENQSIFCPANDGNYNVKSGF